eukprot:764706-Hanusia_phi.AAC.7
MKGRTQTYERAEGWACSKWQEAHPGGCESGLDGHGEGRYHGDNAGGCTKVTWLGGLYNDGGECFWSQAASVHGANTVLPRE